MFCAECGIQLPEDAKFCIQCGRPKNVPQKIIATNLPLNSEKHPEGEIDQLKKQMEYQRLRLTELENRFPKTGLLSHDIRTRAWTVWGHVWLANAMIWLFIAFFAIMILLITQFQR